MVMALQPGQDQTRYAVNDPFGLPMPYTPGQPKGGGGGGGTGGGGNSSSSASLQDRVNFYINNPGSYTDLTYKLDPEAYLAVPIYKAFQNSYGRAPTSNEYNAYANVQRSGGNVESEIASAKMQEDNSPANVYARQQQQWKQNSSQNYGTVDQLIKSSLGRDATQDERDHYGTLIASGQADPYQIQQFLQATPEYQNAQDKTFRSGLDTELQNSDQNFFNRTKGDIIQKYAQMGRATSPALDVALTDLAAKLSDSRQTYLAQLSANQYGSNKDAALKNYSTTQNDVLGRINQNTTGILNNTNANINRTQNINDYSMQQDAYNRALSNSQQKPGALDYLNTGLNVAKTGAEVWSAI